MSKEIVAATKKLNKKDTDNLALKLIKDLNTSNPVVKTTLENYGYLIEHYKSIMEMYPKDAPASLTASMCLIKIYDRLALITNLASEIQNEQIQKKIDILLQDNQILKELKANDILDGQYVTMNKTIIELEEAKALAKVKGDTAAFNTTINLSIQTIKDIGTHIFEVTESNTNTIKKLNLTKYPEEKRKKILENLQSLGYKYTISTNEDIM